MKTLFRSGTKHALEAKRGGGSRYFDDRNQLRASDKQDALQALSEILQGVKNGSLVMASEGEDGNNQVMTAAEKNEQLKAAYHDRNSDNWGRMGLALAAETYEISQRQGIFRNLMRRVDVADGAKPEVEIRRNHVTAVLMTTPSQLMPQYIGDEPTLTLDEFDIEAHVKVYEKTMRRTSTDLLAKAYEDALESFMVMEDRCWKAMADEVVGVEFPLVTISGNLTPANIAYLRQRMSSAGVRARSIVMAENYVSDFLINTEFQSIYDPITQYELIRDGNLARIYDLDVYSDAVRSQPNLRVLQSGDFYMVAAPEQHGFYTDRDGIAAHPIDGYSQGESSRGWFMTEPMSMTIVDPASVAKIQRVS